MLYCLDRLGAVQWAGGRSKWGEVYMGARSHIHVCSVFGSDGTAGIPWPSQNRTKAKTKAKKWAKVHTTPHHTHTLILILVVVLILVHTEIARHTPRQSIRRWRLRRWLCNPRKCPAASQPSAHKGQTARVSWLVAALTKMIEVSYSIEWLQLIKLTIII